jgi:hypothetical protein
LFQLAAVGGGSFAESAGQLLSKLAVLLGKVVVALVGGLKPPAE